MALDMDAQAFLDLKDAEIGPWTAARAAECNLLVPAAALAGVIDNVALLRSQADVFVAALGEHAGELPEAFQP